MKKFWSFEETRRNGKDESQFRGKVAGSNPASPTIKGSSRFVGKEIFNVGQMENP